MAAGQAETPIFDINLVQKATFLLQITLKDENGDVRDLTGYVGASVVRKSLTDTGIVATFSVTFPDAANGRINVSYTAVQTGDLTEFENDDYVYDLMIKIGMTVEKILKGNASLELSVTVI